LSFLKDVYFAGFDPVSPSGLSRHTVAHGVAPSEDFNLKSGTMGFLILEQIRYYLIPDTAAQQAAAQP
jgi:hypothetical protein